MTKEEAIERILHSQPRYVATEEDGEGNAYYGCITNEGRFRFKIETDKLFSGQNLSEKSTEEEIRLAHEIINREICEIRKVLLWKCLGHLVIDGLSKDPEVMKFVAQVVYTPLKPELVTHDDFHQMFQSQN